MKFYTFQVIVASGVDVPVEDVPHWGRKSSCVCDVGRSHVVNPSLKCRISINKRTGSLAVREQVVIVPH